ncbi:IclR family transcriptional regulator domain-containing protein [Streptacidiphilus albus]|uniref:IclR family transcriptional regulator domain-containing protein n=1 Tax=Streptacidiphilus albus TaxID=105425 RepID=UPI0007C73E3D|nr:IclR family transcriptional regulator C-terminal domain-containing protein [Streptacidiphilus albus]
MPPESAVTAPAPQSAVGPLERGLAVLRALGATPSGRARASDLARETGLARSTVDRIVSTLERLDHLRGDPREPSVAPPLMALGNAYLSAGGLPALLGRPARALADELDESVSLAVPDRTGVRFVNQTVRRRTMTVSFRVGDLLPAERCAPGALFAADWTEADREAWLARRQQDPLESGFPALPPRSRGRAPSQEEFAAATAAARERGWAVDDQLIEPGLLALAVPVRGPDGRTVCALSVVSQSSRHDLDSLRALALDRMRATAAAMEAALAAAPAPAERPLPASDLTLGPKDELGPEFLQSLARGLAVLTALGARVGGLTLAETAEATGLSRATARRSLLTLVQLGYAATEGRCFRLLPRVLELGHAQLSVLTLPELAQPHLAELVSQVHESASMAVLDGDDVRYVARVATVRIMSVNITVGTRFPAYATSMGRVLLAALPPEQRAVRLDRAGRLHGFGRNAPTRRTVSSPQQLDALLDGVASEGFALVDQELEEGLRSLAVPVRDRRGRVVAAVNVSTHAGSGSVEATREALLPALRAAADRIEADLAVIGGGDASGGDANGGDANGFGDGQAD